MMMNAKKTILATLLAAIAATPLTLAPLQVQAQAQAQHVYTQAELDQMLAPIALYPDALLSQILMAATYPAEVAEAARWSRANPGLQGDDAVRAAQNEDWDPSVKSLLAFPQILTRMDENPGWTQALGDAFLDQEPQVMDTVQQLRRRAQAAGNLQSSDQLVVQQQGPVILIQPARPEYIYVPYYDPMIVYGPWWWPAYRPVVWAPWPGYARVHRPGVSIGFWWGAPVGLSASFFFGNFDWRERHVRVVNVNNYYYRPPQVVSRTVVVERNRWQHDPSHRRNVSYRTPEVRQRFAEFQPRNNEETRRAEQRRPDERHQVLSRPPEQPQVQQRQAQPAPQQQAPQVQQQAPKVQQQESQTRQEERRARQKEWQVRQQELRARQQQAPQPQRPAPQAPQPAPQPQAQQPAQQPQAQQPAPRPAPQVRREARPRMPEADAPQQQRAERQEQRQERRDAHREQRQERGNKGHKDSS
jgi:hypothetical protein